MGTTISRASERSNKTVELLSMENSTIEAVRDCPPEVLARIALCLGQRECKRIGQFCPEIENAFEIAKNMNWTSYLRGADFEQEEKIDHGFADGDNFLKHSPRISSLMCQDKEKTHVVHMPRYIQWKHSSSLDYEILYLNMVCWLEFKTEMTLPIAKNLHLYFKEHVQHFMSFEIFLKSLEQKKDVFRKFLFYVPSNKNTRNNNNNCR